MKFEILDAKQQFCSCKFLKNIYLKKIYFQDIQEKAEVFCKKQSSSINGRPWEDIKF